jgi:hypothetical protein
MNPLLFADWRVIHRWMCIVKWILVLMLACVILAHRGA